MKILNLYAGIGGNRKLWHDCNCNITAVESNPEIAEIYEDLYPDDNVIVGDAHEYLIKHFAEYDFIWSSPPCQSHSRLNYFNPNQYRYPDMKLYEEILLLKHSCKSFWIVENVIPYYSPLIPPNITLHRHFFWCNFTIRPKQFERMDFKSGTLGKYYRAYRIDLSAYKNKNKRQLMRNCVLPELGRYILDHVQKYRKINFQQEQIKWKNSD